MTTINEKKKRVLEALPSKDKEIFIEEVYIALNAGKIIDVDTNWRMLERVMPINLQCNHEKDTAEISGNYRKIHLSDVLEAARNLIDHYHTAMPDAVEVIRHQDKEIERLRGALEFALGECDKYYELIGGYKHNQIGHLHKQAKQALAHEVGGE